MKRSWVEVDLEALAENIRGLQQALGEGTEIIFVVKANAYGHGAMPLVQRAWRVGVRWFSVAYVQEAEEVRAALPDADILILGASEPDDVPALLAHRLTPVVISEVHGRALGDAAHVLGRTLPVHVKIDTGMGRLGLDWETAADAYRELLAHPGLDIRGVCSHFATVEPDEPDAAEEQIRRFDAFEEARRQIDPRPVMRHISSSRATLYFGRWDLDAVRPGIMLYGYGAQDDSMRTHTRPVLQWKSYVMQVRKVPADFAVGYYSTYRTTEATTLATLCVGYADGFLRTLSNRGFVLIRGRRCKVVGRVTMNWLTVDVGSDSEVEAGDEAVLIGRQGDEEIWAGELARLCRTIPYEILTNINASIERRYVG